MEGGRESKSSCMLYSYKYSMHEQAGVRLNVPLCETPLSKVRAPQ